VQCSKSTSSHLQIPRAVAEQRRFLGLCHHAELQVVLSTTMEGSIVFTSVTAYLVLLAFSSNGNAEPSNTARSKRAWAASRAFLIE